MDAADNDVDLSSAPKPDEEPSLIESMDESKVEETSENNCVIGDKVNDEPVVSTIDTTDTTSFPAKPQEDEVAGNTDQVMDTDEAIDDPVVDIKVSDGKDGDRVREEEPEEVTEDTTVSKEEAEAIAVSKEETKNITVSEVDEGDEPMEADEPQEEPIPLSLTKDEPLEPEVSKDEPLELSVPREEPLELKVSKEDEPLELKVSKDEPLELKVSKGDEPLELKVSKGDEPLEVTQDEPLELKVKSPSEAPIVNGNRSGFVPMTNGVSNGGIVNGNGLDISQDDDEMEREEMPPLKELSAEELEEKERRIRKLRYQLEEEEMKLVLLRKIRQSQILKENDVRIDGPSRDSTRVDGKIDSRSERSLLPPSVHGPSTLHHQSLPHASSVHGTIPGHLPAPYPPTHHSRTSSHHHSSGASHLPPPSRHSMATSGHGHHSSIMSGPPAHSGHHRLDTSSHDRHRVRDHGSRSSDPSRMSRSGVFNPPVPQIHARAHSGIPSHHGPPPGMTPAHSGHHSSRSSLPSSAVPAPAHGGHVRSTMPGSAVSSSSSRVPITTPPNVVVGYTPPPPAAVKPERGVETPGQKLEKAKKAIRANLEKTLLNLPLPKVPTPEMHFVPNFNQLEFQYYMGLEAVVDILTDSPNIGKPPPDPFECFQCGTDFTPVWKWQDVPDPKGSSRPPVICETCVTKNIKRAIRNDHTAKIKAAIQAAAREEKEVEAKIAAGTYSPPSASPSLERVERLSSAPPPAVPPNVVVPMAAPSPPSIPSSFVNSNVAHRSSREHRRDHGHHRDSGSSSHGHHGHMRDPMIGSSAGMIAPPAAHSSGSAYSSSARMSGDELGRRRERSPQVRDTGSSSSMSSSAAAAAAAAASAAAVNAAAAQIFAQMQKMTPQQQALFLSQSLGPMANPQAMLSLAPLLLGQFGLAGLGAPPTGTGSGSKSTTSSNQMTPEQMQQRMFLEMMTNPTIAGLGLPPQPGTGSGSSSRSSHRDSSGYRNH